MRTSTCFAISGLLATFFSSAALSWPQEATTKTRAEVVGTREASTSVTIGTKYIVTIGIDQYQHWPVLSNAVSDARGVAEAFAEKFPGFKQISLLNQEATKTGISHLIEDILASQLKSDDELVLFFAGHGSTRVVQVGNTPIKTGYLIPIDARDSSQDAHWSDYLQLDNFLGSLSKLPARHILVIIDACKSGIALGQAASSSRGDDRYQEDLAKRISRRVITSAREDESAIDGGPIPGHSLFTGTLINAINWGKLDRDGKGFVTSSDIGYFLESTVGRASHSKQTPDFGAFALDDRGEIVLTLSENTFSGIKIAAASALRRGDISRFREYTDKAIKAAPDAPETVYFEYRDAIISGDLTRAQAAIARLAATNIQDGILPLSSYDIQSLGYELRYWAPVLTLPGLTSGLGVSLAIESTVGPLKTLSGGVPIERAKVGTAYKWQLTNNSAVQAFCYELVFDSDGRLSVPALFNGDLVYDGIPPGVTMPSYEFRHDSPGLDVITFIVSQRRIGELISPPGIGTRAVQPGSISSDYLGAAGAARAVHFVSFGDN